MEEIKNYYELIEKMSQLTNGEIHSYEDEPVYDEVYFDDEDYWSPSGYIIKNSASEKEFTAFFEIFKRVIEKVGQRNIRFGRGRLDVEDFNGNLFYKNRKGDISIIEYIHLKNRSVG